MLWNDLPRVYPAEELDDEGWDDKGWDDEEWYWNDAGDDDSSVLDLPEPECRDPNGPERGRSVPGYLIV